MSSFAQNSRVLESRQRFGADRSVVCSPENSDSTLQALQSYLITGWVVPPLHVHSGYTRPWSYQPPSGTKPPVGDNDIRSALAEAVNARLLPSYKRIGVALSGGLDSTIIAALCRAVLDRQQIMAFTLDFGPPWSDEVVTAREIARHLDIPLFIVDASPDAILTNVNAATAAMISPYGDAVCVPWFLLGKAAADAGCTALFSGEGGDQVFGGWANKPMVTELALTGVPLESVYAKTFHRFLDDLPDLIIPQKLQGGNDKPFDVHAWIRSCLPQERDLSLLATLRHLNFATKGGGTILPRFTELVEVHKVDAHAPFFDTELVVAASSMPDSTILDGATDKAILRTLVAEMTSPEIAALPKRGMGVPSTHWATGDHALGKQVRKVLGRRNKHRDQRIHQEYVDMLMSGIVDAPDAYRRRRLGERIWTLFQWEVFREVHSLSE